MIKTIVVGLDGSESSENALVMACDLAGKYGASLHLVHVPQPDTVAFALGGIAGYHAVTTMPSEDEVKEAADKIVAAGKRLASDHGQLIAQVHIERGTPADEIVAYAKKLQRRSDRYGPARIGQPRLADPGQHIAADQPSREMRLPVCRVGCAFCGPEHYTN